MHADLVESAESVLGEERAKRIQDMLDARTRAIICASGEMGTQWYAGSGWRARSEKLFAAAGEVAVARGAPLGNRGDVAPIQPASGRSGLQ